MDSMLRIDRVLASLLDCIDREVGLANCVIVLTADHGVPPNPERVQALRKGIAGGRIVPGLMDAPARKALTDAFGALPGDEYWFTRNNYGYHIRPSALTAKNLKQDDVAQVLKASIQQHPFIAAVYTKAELLAEEPQGDSLLAMVRRSYYGPSDRDVVYVLKPYYMDKADYGTTHGSPYDYDTHVPQLWFGRGVPRGEVHHERVGVDDIAPTLSSLLGIPVPPQAQGRRLF
jgi:arylsulfatase A-like enzyme